jgi:hypothetical protein
MKVDELLKQVNDNIGQVIELEGYLLAYSEGDKFTAYLAANGNGNGVPKIEIEQPLAEIRKIIQPMHTLILPQREKPNNSLSLYNFPLHLSAQVALGDDDEPMLRDIQVVSLYVEHPPNMAKHVEQKRYLYSAEVMYSALHNPFNDQPAKAKITTHKVLRFAASNYTPQVLHPNQNMYTRLIAGKPITVPGWLKYIDSTDDSQPHYILRTFAVRAAMVGVGPLRSMTSIWWRPCPQYSIVRTHLPLSEDTPDILQRVEITGRIDYLRDESVPIETSMQPQLVFMQVDEIVIHQEDYLLETKSPH